MLLFAVVSACTRPPPAAPPNADADADSDSDSDSDSDAPEAGPGVIVLAGGGSEADVGDAAGWSARLYRRLLDGGDVTGDGRVRVAVVSAAPESEWLPDYFEFLGADEGFNLQVGDPGAADDPGLEALFAEVDAAFLKGGDQGLYYDLYNERRLEDQLRALWERGGGIGGTSAGAMALAQYALAGGQDLISRDVLEDAHTPYLDDASDGGSGIHDDFLGFVSDVVIDTHFTERGRLGRLAGAMAKVLDDLGPTEVRGIGLEQRTGLAITAGRADVIGVGSVSLLSLSATSPRIRDPGRPLQLTDLALDRLTDGWAFDLTAWAVDTVDVPASASPVTPDDAVDPNVGAWQVRGHRPSDEERFETVAVRPRFALRPGADPIRLNDAVGLLDAHYADTRAVSHEVLFRALHDRIGHTGMLIGYGGMALRTADAPDHISFADNDQIGSEPDLAAILVGTSSVRWRSLAPEASSYDVDGSLHAAALVGCMVHLVADSARTGWVWDAEARGVRLR